MEIRFQSLTRTTGERRSKLLDLESQLYKKLKNIQKAIDASEIDRAPDRMDLHIELLGRDNRDDIVLQRSRVDELEGRVLNLKDPNSWIFVDKAFCLATGPVKDLTPHITMAFLGRSGLEITPKLLERLREIALGA
jgi:hypothetical protein